MSLNSEFHLEISLPLLEQCVALRAARYISKTGIGTMVPDMFGRGSVAPLFRALGGMGLVWFARGPYAP